MLSMRDDFWLCIEMLVCTQRHSVFLVRCVVFACSDDGVLLAGGAGTVRRDERESGERLVLDRPVGQRHTEHELLFRLCVHCTQSHGLLRVRRLHCRQLHIWRLEHRAELLECARRARAQKQTPNWFWFERSRFDSLFLICSHRAVRMSYSQWSPAIAVEFCLKWTTRTGKSTQTTLSASRSLFRVWRALIRAPEALRLRLAWRSIRPEASS